MVFLAVVLVGGACGYFCDVVHFSPPFWVRWWFVFLQETYELLDAKYYADNTKINSLLTSFDNHQVAFIPYTVGYGDKITFKYNTKPTHSMIGIGTSSSSSFVLEFTATQTKYYRSSGNSGSYNNSWLPAHSEFGFEVVQVSSSADRTNISFEGTYYDYWGCQLRSNNNGLRVDKYPNDDYDIEVIVL